MRIENSATTKVCARLRPGLHHRQAGARKDAERDQDYLQRIVEAVQEALRSSAEFRGGEAGPMPFSETGKHG